MNAYLFSIGESTTDIARWSLERLGLTVITLGDPKTTFYEKYVQFLDMAHGQERVVRCDADVIVDRNGFRDLEAVFKGGPYLWVCGQVYCHLKRAMTYGGVNIMAGAIMTIGKARIREYAEDSRPESRLSRCEELYVGPNKEQRLFRAFDIFTGNHAWRQRPEDINRVLAQKENRGQLKSWDHELIERMNNITP